MLAVCRKATTSLCYGFAVVRVGWVLAAGGNPGETCGATSVVARRD